jgi:uncharacterized protein YceK
MRRMKTKYVLAVLAVSGALLGGCASTTTTTTTQAETDQTTKRVHTQEELRKTGETDQAHALEKTDASARVQGR